jgi:hypothetical protein
MPELACRITGEEVALADAALHDLPRARAHALVVERRAALAAALVRILGDVDVVGPDGLAQAVLQEAGLAVERTAAGALHVGAEQAGRHRRFEQHRHLGRGTLRDFSRASARSAA